MGNQKTEYAADLMIPDSRKRIASEQLSCDWHGMNEKRLNGLINRVRYEEGIKACLLQQRGNSLPFYDDKQQTEKQIFLSKKTD